MPWWTFEQNMLTVVCLAAQTSTEHWTLFRASEETTEQCIYWFIYCMLLPHRSNIITPFITQLFTFTDITDCFCNSCVFNVNLVYSHAVTAAFCPCASDVCAQKTVYQKFKLIWFKTHDFNTINMIIRTKTMFSAGTSCNGAALLWKRGRGEQQLICI